jgi:hypothetical protein
MKHHGCTGRYWHLCASPCGAALDQARLAVVYFQADDLCDDGPVQPEHLGGPTRAMSNLLLPVGIPHKAWNRQAESMAERDLIKRHLPCSVRATINGSPVVESSGPMPDAPNTWIRLERGVRRLQSCEMAKAKGMPGNWTMKSTTWKNSWVKDSTSLHIWTAALDSIGEWLETTTEVTSATKVKATSSPSKPTMKDTNGTSEGKPPRLKTEDDEPDWSWQVPDLQPGGAWYNDRVCNLRQAVATLGSPVQLYLGGLEIVEIHRRNYLTEGPKNLQLLW